MASKRTIVIKLCLFLHILEVLLGIVLSVFSFLLQNAADVGLAETPSWLGIPCAFFGLVGIIIIVLNKLKEELVFVLVFHGLIIGLCIICLILVAPKVAKWEPVSKYQENGGCKQFDKRCNCTISLPTKVYKCIDLTGIYDLALSIAVIVGLCLTIAVLAAYFDFLIISKYVPKDNQLRSQSKKGPFDEAQLADSYEEIGHVGPLNTPDLVPKLDDDIPSRINSVEWDKSELDVPLQEDFQMGGRNSICSASSLPVDQAVVQTRHPSLPDRMRSLSMPNSVAGSKQSIRSRKDTLLRRLQSVQADDDLQNGAEDEQDDAILTQLDNDTRRSSEPYGSRKDMNGVGLNSGSRTSMNNNNDYNERNKPTDGERTDTVSTINNGSCLKVKEKEQSKRSYSESNFRKNLLQRQFNVNATQRSMSEGNFIDGTEKNSIKSGSLGQLQGSGSEKVPGKDEEKMTSSNIYVNKEDEEHLSSYEQQLSTGPLRRSGFSNRDLHGLPPLPLKNLYDDLSVTDRTFSAPSLPFFENNGKAAQQMPRPGSSGSQVLARKRRDPTPQTRNNLIDKESLVQQENEGIYDNGISENDSEPRRKNSYETVSTDIDMDDHENASENLDEHGRKPRWHPPWQLKQEIIAHKDAVPMLAIEPRNRWFASGSVDKTIKIWDIKSGNCRLTVKGHKAGVRAATFGSSGHRFIYSAGDDRQLLCTDIEVNRIVSHYPDQSSVIYAMAMYRQAELLVTCGRDKYVRIWDTREKKCIKTMRGHMNTVSSLAILENSGQIVSGSHDSTMRIWDIGEGRCTQILTGHEKSIRSIVVHPEEPFISSASTERIIHWSMPDGEKVNEITPKDISINCISINPQGALVAAGSNGVIHLWDWKSGHKFQKIHRTRVYESQEVPICVFSVVFDKTGSRLLVSDASNIIKVYGEAYTRVRRRFNIADEKQGRRKSSRFPIMEDAFT